MALSDCPFDPELGLWVLSTRWIPKTCQHGRCKNPVEQAITLCDYYSNADVTIYVCRFCADRYNGLPKKEVL